VHPWADHLNSHRRPNLLYVENAETKLTGLPTTVQRGSYAIKSHVNNSEMSSSARSLIVVGTGYHLYVFLFTVLLCWSSWLATLLSVHDVLLELIM
jgi:hypothetical protein